MGTHTHTHTQTHKHTHTHTHTYIYIYIYVFTGIVYIKHFYGKMFDIMISNSLHLFNNPIFVGDSESVENLKVYLYKKTRTNTKKTNWVNLKECVHRNSEPGETETIILRLDFHRSVLYIYIKDYIYIYIYRERERESERDLKRMSTCGMRKMCSYTIREE